MSDSEISGIFSADLWLSFITFTTLNNENVSHHLYRLCMARHHSSGRKLDESIA